MKQKPTAILLLWRYANNASHCIRASAERYFDIRFMRYLSFGEAVNQDYLAEMGVDYLISFSPLIIKRHVLESVQIAAVNFHTAPPKYPGRGGCSYALYNGDTEYGVTAHLMTERVDAGAILDTEYFPIAPDDTALTLQNKALDAIPTLARQWMKTRSLTPNGEQWHGKAKTQADFMRFMQLCPNDDIERKIAACARPDKPGPYVEIDGRKFWYIGA